MRESYRLSARAELLYNIARLEGELGECTEALAHYREYVELVPQGQYRAAAEQASADLAKRCSPDAPDDDGRAQGASSAVAAGSTLATATARVEPAATTVALPPPQAESSTVAESYWTTRRRIGWAAVVAGTLAGAGSVYFTIAAIDSRDRFRSSLEREEAGGPRADFGLQDEQHLNERWAQALGVSAGALLGAGALVLLLPQGSAARSKVSATFWVSPGQLSAQVSQSF